MTDISGKRDAPLCGADFISCLDYYQAMVSLCPDAIVGVNRPGTIILFNEAAEELIGVPAGHVLDKAHICDVIYSSWKTARLVKKNIYSEEYGGPGRLDEMDLDVKNASGQLVPIRLSATLLLRRGEEVGSIGYFHDLTARKQLEEELRQLSITCSLTGLHNRRHFYSVLTDEIQRSHRYGRSLSLVLVDLDKFKPVNDRYGHQEGDNVLRMVADCALQTFRTNDYAFRLGGDEFVIILVESNLSEACLAAERFRKAFQKRLTEVLSFHPGGAPQVAMSLGVAELVHGESSESILKRADLAMYRAKRAGGDRTFAADPPLNMVKQG